MKKCVANCSVYGQIYPLPKNKTTAKLWLSLVGRKDLINKSLLNELYNYGICDNHFTSKMLLNDNKLCPWAIPDQNVERLDENYMNTYDEEETIDEKPLDLNDIDIGDTTIINEIETDYKIIEEKLLDMKEETDYDITEQNVIIEDPLDTTYNENENENENNIIDDNLNDEIKLEELYTEYERKKHNFIEKYNIQQSSDDDDDNDDNQKDDYEIFKRKKYRKKIQLISRGIQCKLDNDYKKLNNIKTKNKCISTDDYDINDDIELFNQKLEDEDDIVRKRFIIINDNNNDNNNNIGELKCLICGQISKTEAFMRCHQRRHIQQCLLCYKCGLYTKTANSLKSHELECFKDELKKQLIEYAHKMTTEFLIQNNLELNNIDINYDGNDNNDNDNNGTIVDTIEIENDGSFIIVDGAGGKEIILHRKQDTKLISSTDNDNDIILNFNKINDNDHDENVSIKNINSENDVRNDDNDDDDDDDDDNNDDDDDKNKNNNKKKIILNSLDEYYEIDPILLRNSKRFSSKKDRTCRVCGIISETMKLHKIHLNKHYGLRSFKCCCGKEFTASSTFYGHTKNCIIEQKRIQIQKKLNDIKKRKNLLSSSTTTSTSSTITTTKTSSSSNNNDNNNFTCSQCNINFINRRELICHKKEFHLSENLLQCKICDTIYASRSGLRNHIINLHLKKILCKLCNKKFSQKLFKKHLKLSHNIINNDDDNKKESMKIHPCNLCTKKFALKRSVTRHKTMHHGIISTYGKKNHQNIDNEHEKILSELEKQQQKQQQESPTLSTSEQQLSSSILLEPTESSTFEPQPPPSSELCQSSSSSPTTTTSSSSTKLLISPQSSKLSPISTNYYCFLCERKLKSKKLMIKHLRNDIIHNNLENDWKNNNKIEYFKCIRCININSKTFVDYAEHQLKHGNRVLTRMKHVFDTIKTINLDNNKIILKNNNQKITNNNNKIISKIINNNSNNSNDNDNHNNIDENNEIMNTLKEAQLQLIKQINDNINNDKIDDPTKLINNKKNDIKLYNNEIIREIYENGKKIIHYCCNICQKYYINRQSLYGHLKHDHNDKVQCEHCGKKMNYHFLKTHLRIHTGERPFKCTLCDKKFIACAHLTNHIKRSHTTNNKRIYKCYICNEKCTYATFNGIRTHLEKSEHKLIENEWKFNNNLDYYRCNRCPDKFLYFRDFAKHSSHQHNMHYLTKMKTVLQVLTGKYNNSNNNNSNNDNNNDNNLSNIIKRKKPNRNYNDNDFNKLLAEFENDSDDNNDLNDDNNEKITFKRGRRKKLSTTTATATAATSTMTSSTITSIPITLRSIKTVNENNIDNFNETSNIIIREYNRIYDNNDDNDDGNIAAATIIDQYNNDNNHDDIIVDVDDELPTIIKIKNDDLNDDEEILNAYSSIICENEEHSIQDMIVYEPEEYNENSTTTTAISTTTTTTGTTSSSTSFNYPNFTEIIHNSIHKYS